MKIFNRTNQLTPNQKSDINIIRFAKELPEAARPGFDDILRNEAKALQEDRSNAAANRDANITKRADKLSDKKLKNKTFVIKPPFAPPSDKETIKNDAKHNATLLVKRDEAHSQLLICDTWREKKRAYLEKHAPGFQKSPTKTPEKSKDKDLGR